jgi:repressor LexA
MENAATKRQLELLNIVYRYTRETGYPPTFEEMREELGVSSNQSVLDLLQKLEEKDLIKRDEGAARGLVILPAGHKALGKPPLAPFAGMAAAGAPLEPLEITGEWQPLSEELSKPKDDVFLLKVLGDSMVNAGIDDSDVVLVQKQKEFVSGDVVLARHEDGVTIKRFISDDTPPFIYLKPENPKHQVIPVNETTRLEGKVVSVLKNGFWSSVK